MGCVHIPPDYGSWFATIAANLTVADYWVKVPLYSPIIVAANAHSVGWPCKRLPKRDSHRRPNGLRVGGPQGASWRAHMVFPTSNR